MDDSQRVTDLKPFAQFALFWCPVGFASVTLGLLATLGGDLLGSLFGLEPGAPIIQQPGGHGKMLGLMLAILIWLGAAFALAHLVGRALVSRRYGSLDPGRKFGQYPKNWFK
jgi:hypothetical protein